MCAHLVAVVVAVRPTTRLAIDTLARGCTEAWIKDIVAVNQCKGPGLHYPIIADPERTVAHALGMLDEKARDAGDMPLTCRAVYIIGPDKKLKLSLLYPASTGRNFGEDRSAYSTRSLQSTSHLHRHPPPSPSPSPSPSPPLSPAPSRRSSACSTRYSSRRCTALPPLPTGSTATSAWCEHMHGFEIHCYHSIHSHLHLGDKRTCRPNTNNHTTCMRTGAARALHR